MKKLSMWIGCVLILTLCGCYESSAPLGPAGKVKINSSLLGDWKCLEISKRSDRSPIYSVRSFDNTQYLIEEFEGGAVKSRYRAYETKIGEHSLLNLTDVNSSTKTPTWVFLRYKIRSDNRLEIDFVDSHAVKETAQQAALKSIQNRVADDSLYTQVYSCQRQ